MDKYKNQIEEIKRSGLFDKYYYRQNYPEIEKFSERNEILHYLTIGWKKGYNPSQVFDTNYYLEQNPDVARTDFNPFVHYVRHGRKENRLTHKPRKYFLTMATCIKNEGRYLDEWISYYIYQGVEHFYLNDDESTDNTKEILKPYIDKGYVTVYEGLRKQGIFQTEFFKKIFIEKKQKQNGVVFLM